MVARRSGSHCNVTCKNVIAWLAILQCKVFCSYFVKMKAVELISITCEVNKWHFHVITAIFSVTLLKLTRCIISTI